MRFFSKLVFLFNCCFIISVVLRYIEIVNKAKGNTEALVKLPLIQGTIVVMGYTAVILNLVFVIAALYLLLSKKLTRVPRWIVIFNLLIFVWQIAFHFNLY